MTKSIITGFLFSVQKHGDTNPL